jgi:hypothetical protein
MTSLQARKATRYVIGSDQKVEPDEWPIEALELGRGEVFELRDLKAVPELPGSAHLLGTDAATPCAIVTHEFVGGTPFFSSLVVASMPAGRLAPGASVG